MTQEEIDQIPEKIKNNQISYEKAIWKLLSEFYFHPSLYIKGFIDEDIKSELIIQMKPKMKILIDRHNSSIRPFSFYFALYIANSYLSLKRGKLIKNFSESAIKENLKLNFQDVQECYNREEAGNTYEFCEKAPYFGSDKKARYAKKQQGIRHIRNKYSLFWPGKTSKQKKLTILALKACYYIKEEQVEYICKECGYDKSQFQKKLDILRAGINKKIESRRIFLTKRDSSYFFHKRYAIMLSTLTPGSPLHNVVKEKYLAHTESWKEKNKMLHENRYRLCPKDKSIADVVGISVRQVSNYIAEIRKNYKKLYSDA